MNFEANKVTVSQKTYCVRAIYFIWFFQYRDSNDRAEFIIKKQHNVPDDMTIFFIEIELETHQIEISEESVSYPLGKYIGRLVSLHEP